jgi:hypothetical protein
MKLQLHYGTSLPLITAPANLFHHECARGLIDWTNQLLISGNRMDKRGKMESYFHFGGRFERKGIE